VKPRAVFLASVAFALLAIIGTLSSCGTPKPTPTPTVPPTPTPGCDAAAIVTFLNEFDRLIGEWDDTNALAASTARIALSPIIQSLQDIKRRVGDLDAPCKEAEDLRAVTVTYMDFVVSAYLSFISDRPDAEVKARFDQAQEAQQEMAKHYVAVEAYVP
jgi:hypothetical protein